MNWEPKDLVRLIRKRLWVILITMIVICGATAGLTYFVIEPEYAASTKLIVNKKEPVGQLPTDSINLNDVNTNILLIQTYKEIIQTPAIMDRVIEQYPEIPYSPEALINRIEVDSVNNTQVMTLRWQDYDYNQAVQIVNAITAVFTQQIQQIYNIDNVTVLYEAKERSNPLPVAPNRTLNMVIGFLASVILGILLAITVDYFDDRIRTEEDVEKMLELTVLASIVKLHKRDFKLKRIPIVPQPIVQE